MSILSDFEDSVARAVEGVFAGVFRSRVQPAELARALGKEMDRRRVVGVGKVYAPNLYTVVISPADEERLGSFTETLAAELATYLVGYAREKGYSLEDRPFVRFRVHEGLKLGRFEAIGELVSASELAEAAEAAGFYVPPEAPVRDESPRQRQAAPSELATADAAVSDRPHRPGPGVTIPPSAIPMKTGVGEAGGAGAAGAGLATGAAGAGLAAGVAAVETGRPPADAAELDPSRQPKTIRRLSTLTVTGIEHDVVLNGDRLVVGRATTSDIRLPDANVSREHAVLTDDGTGWTVSDLGSTNGTFLNGELIQQARLHDGDVIALGVSELVYHEPRG